MNTMRNVALLFQCIELLQEIKQVTQQLHSEMFAQVDPPH
jgi:hypothetical protein